MVFPQQRERTSPGLDVTIATSFLSVKPRPSLCPTSFATLSSPCTFFVPDGPQSEPRQIETFCLVAAVMSVVVPYSQRFENGDQAIAPAWPSSHCFQPTGSTALQCTPTKVFVRQPALFAAVNSRATREFTCPSAQ